MKVAIIGSRNLTVENFWKYLPPDTTEIVSGGARGIDTSARDFAQRNGIKLTEFRPEYFRYGDSYAPLARNLEIIKYADIVLAFWDGMSTGTARVICNCKRMGVPVKVFEMPRE